MAGQHSLKRFYEDVQGRAEAFLKENYNALPLDDITDGGKAYKIDLKVNCNLKNVGIILGLPFNFPDCLPTVSVEKDIFKKIYPIPHLNSEMVLCTFDVHEVIPNANNPEGIIKEILKRARDNLEKGIKGLNKEDFIDEYSAYWDQDVQGIYYSIVPPSDKAELICLFKYKDDDNEGGIFAKSRLHAKNWLENFRGNCTEGKTITALYLPIKGFGYPPFPKANKDIYTRLKENDSDNLKELMKFLRDNDRPSYILFSLPLQQGFFFGAWKHNKPYKEEAIGTKRKIIKHSKGFRPGKAPVELELIRDFPKNPVSLLQITRADKERLYFRGGDDIAPLNDLSVSVIGCGSIGSNLADKLVKIGVNQICLVDDEKLSFDNVTRHLCGASYVGKHKTKAVQDLLQKHYPHLKVTTEEKGIIELLIENQGYLNKFDLSIVAIGNTAIEFRLNHLVKSSLIKSPMLFVWVEPYLAAGHAVYINPNNKGCLRCLFDQDLFFQERVLKNPRHYTRREAGCQTTFIPYGALGIDNYLAELAKFIIKVCGGGLTKNTVFTWLGNLSEMRKKNRTLQSKWVGKSNYQAYEEIILDKFLLCEDCQLEV